MPTAPSIGLDPSLHVPSVPTGMCSNKRALRAPGWAFSRLCTGSAFCLQTRSCLQRWALALCTLGIYELFQADCLILRIHVHTHTRTRTQAGGWLVSGVGSEAPVRVKAGVCCDGNTLAPRGVLHLHLPRRPPGLGSPVISLGICVSVYKRKHSVLKCHCANIFLVTSGVQVPCGAAGLPPGCEGVWVLTSGFVKWRIFLS